MSFLRCSFGPLSSTHSAKPSRTIDDDNDDNDDDDIDDDDRDSRATPRPTGDDDGLRDI